MGQMTSLTIGLGWNNIHIQGFKDLLKSISYLDKLELLNLDFRYNSLG